MFSQVELSLGGVIAHAPFIVYALNSGRKRVDEQAVGDDGDMSSRARRKCVISFYNCGALDSAARRRSTAAFGAFRGVTAQLNVRYYIDPETGEPHIQNHRVSEAEVEAVLARAGEDRPGSEGSRIAIGQTSAGRYMRVIYVPEPVGVFVITAYELAGKPLLAYRRRKRKKSDEQTHQIS